MQIKGMHPTAKVEYKNAEIYIAETELEQDRPNEYPWGYYQTFWVVRPQGQDNRFDGGAWLEFEAMHDPDRDWTLTQKADARENSALEQAQKWIDASNEMGRYNG